MASPARTLQRTITGRCTLAFGWCMGRLPLPLARLWAGALGMAAYYLVPRIRNVGLANLDLAYGDTKSRQEKRRILKEAVHNVAMVAAEFPQLPRAAARGFEGHVRYEGAEHLQGGGNVIGISAHIGNWEWLGPAFVNLGHQVGIVVRPFDHAPLNRHINGVRTCNGVVTIPKDDAGRELAALLRGGATAGVLADQSPRHNAVPTTFFGAPCWSTAAPVMLALRTKRPMVPVALLREKGGAYVFRFYPPIPLTRSGSLRQDLVENSQRCQDALESIVRAHPGQWLWFHRRWKARPRLQEEWEARRKRDAAG